MEWLAPILGVVIPVVIGGAFWLGRSLPRAAGHRSLLSPVTQQHLHLFQGGRLSEAAVETAKARLGTLLAQGCVAEAEATLRPGLSFAVQVQALAELGGVHAGRLLRRQLHRRLSDDPIEQSWYWIDLAHGLRKLNRAESLPDLLQCPASSLDAPLSQFFAAETVCCSGFLDYLRRPSSALGRTAMRVLYQTLVGLRHGLQPRVVGDGRIGEALARLWKSRPRRIDARLTLILIEAMRQLQRADHTGQSLAGHPSAAEGFRRQMGEILLLEDKFADYLDRAAQQLPATIDAGPDEQRPDTLMALEELRVDAAAAILPRITQWPIAHREPAVRLLTWSRHAEVGPWLVAWAAQWVQPERRARRHSLADAPTQPSAPAALPYAAILRALRGHPSPLVEAFTLAAARDWDPTFRVAALNGLAWRTPFSSRSVISTLNSAREDPSAAVRLAANGALARLGERRALQWFRQTLVGDGDTPVPEAIRRVATEGLTWLWPELNQLAESDDAEVAHHAREALEQLREEALGGL